MKTGNLWSGLSILTGVLAHTRFTTLHINSVSQGDFKCIRSDHRIGTTTNYIASLTSTDAVCGVDGLSFVPTTCDAKAGDKISLEHRQVVDTPFAGAIDVSHLGSTAIYMKRLNSVADSGQGDGWFKIAWSGYDTSTARWGTQVMMANNGKVDAIVPSDLPSGIYLVRSEVVSLQNVVGNSVLPQMYVGCAQVRIEGSSDSSISAQTVAMPGHVNNQSPAMNFNIYKTPLPLPFVEFGPPVYKQSIGASPSRDATTGTATIPNQPAALIPSPQSSANHVTSNDIVASSSYRPTDSTPHAASSVNNGQTEQQSTHQPAFTGDCRPIQQHHSPWTNWHNTRRVLTETTLETIPIQHSSKRHESSMQRRNRMVRDRKK